MGHVLDSTLKIHSFLQSLPISHRLCMRFFEIQSTHPLISYTLFSQAQIPTRFGDLTPCMAPPGVPCSPPHLNQGKCVCSTLLRGVNLYLVNATICSLHSSSAGDIRPVSLVLAVKVNAHVTTCLPRREKKY
jgi:hypothetical protein